MNIKHKILYTGLFLSLFIIVAILAFTMGIYLTSWDTPFTKTLLRIIPLPVAIVDQSFISFNEVNQRTDIYKKIVESRTKYDFSTPEGKLELATQRSNIVREIIKNRIIADLARKSKIRIDNNEIEEYYNFLLVNFDISKEDATPEIENLFGISVQKFKDTFVLPDLRKSKLKIAFFHQNQDSPEYKRITQARSALVSGGDFAELAETYSDDESSKFIAGELGFLSHSDMGPWLAGRAFSLDIGQISDIVISPSGYHIMQVISKDMENNKLNLRHIFVNGPNFEEYFEKERQTYKAYTFKKI